MAKMLGQDLFTQEEFDAFKKDEFKNQADRINSVYDILVEHEETNDARFKKLTSSIVFMRRTIVVLAIFLVAAVTKIIVF